MNPARRIILLLAITTTLVTVAGWVLWPITPPTQFSAHAWQRTPEAKREPMAKDFIANHFRLGMTRAELVALLGNPGGSPRALYYKVGEAMIDDRILCITLDEDGKAVSATIYQLS